MGNCYLQNSLQGILENKFAVGELKRHEDDTKMSSLNDGKNDLGEIVHKNYSTDFKTEEEIKEEPSDYSIAKHFRWFIV